MIYLDNSATTRPLPAAAEAVHHCLTEAYFNPSSAYGPAVAVERSVEESRTRLAQSLGASTSEIIYTSGRHRIQQYGDTRYSGHSARAGGAYYDGGGTSVCV